MLWIMRIDEYWSLQPTLKIPQVSMNRVNDNNRLFSSNSLLAFFKEKSSIFLIIRPCKISSVVSTPKVSDETTNVCINTAKTYEWIPNLEFSIVSSIAAVTNKSFCIVFDSGTTWSSCSVCVTYFDPSSYDYFHPLNQNFEFMMSFGIVSLEIKSAIL